MSGEKLLGDEIAARLCHERRRAFRLAASGRRELSPAGLRRPRAPFVLQSVIKS